MARRQGSFTDFLSGSDSMRADFNPYAAGDKRYGMSGRDAPNIGPTSSPEGYKERDRLAKVKRNYMLRVMKARHKGRAMSPEALRGQNRHLRGLPDQAY